MLTSPLPASFFTFHQEFTNGTGQIIKGIEPIGFNIVVFTENLVSGVFVFIKSSSKTFFECGSISEEWPVEDGKTENSDLEVVFERFAILLDDGIVLGLELIVFCYEER